MKTNAIHATLAKIGGAGLALTLLIGGAMPSAALTAKECSDKYNAAKSAGTLGGKSWNQFRKTECTAGATTTTPAADAKKEAPKVTVPSKSAQPVPTPPAAQAKPATPAPTAAPKAAAPAATGGPTTYPTAIAPAYAKEKPSKARMHTCLDQYKANKAAGTLGGLKWIQKAGGYYSECNKRLKGGT